MKRTYDLYDLTLFTLVVAFFTGVSVAGTNVLGAILYFGALLSAATFWSGRKQPRDKTIDVMLRVVVTFGVMVVGMMVLNGVVLVISQFVRWN
jgi:hypothetical protein